MSSASQTSWPAHAQEAPPTLIDRIINAIRQHIGTTPQRDDITLLIVKRDA